MKKEELFDIIGELDEQKIKDAGEIRFSEEREVKYVKTSGKKKFNIALKYVAVAACVCLAAGVAIPSFISKNYSAQKAENMACDDIMSQNESVAVNDIKLAEISGYQDKELEILRAPEQSEPVAIAPGGPANDLMSKETSESNANVPSDAPLMATSEPWISVGDPRKNPDPKLETSGSQGTEVKPLISSFSAGEREELVKDIAIANGSVSYSDELIKAIEHYGDNAIYRVMVLVYKDGAEVPVGPSLIENEMARLNKKGYTTAIENIKNESGDWTSYFTLHALADQLKGFDVNPMYGYLLMLYDEYFE